MQSNQFSTIASTDLETVTGGAEGVMGAVRAGLLGLSLLTGSPTGSAPPEVNPIRIQQPVSIPRPGGSSKP